MSDYSFSGKMKLGRGTQPFTREVEAESEKHAREKLYSQLGSEHSITRGKISIEEVES